MSLFFDKIQNAAASNKFCPSEAENWRSGAGGSRGDYYLLRMSGAVRNWQVPRLTIFFHSAVSCGVFSPPSPVLSSGRPQLAGPLFQPINKSHVLAGTRLPPANRSISPFPFLEFAAGRPTSTEILISRLPPFPAVSFFGLCRWLIARNPTPLFKQLFNAKSIPNYAGVFFSSLSSYLPRYCPPSSRFRRSSEANLHCTSRSSPGSMVLRGSRCLNF